jgi:hypothetical protein
LSNNQREPPGCANWTSTRRRWNQAAQRNVHEDTWVALTTGLALVLATLAIGVLL